MSGDNQEFSRDKAAMQGAWPFHEAQRILDSIKNTTPKKGHVLICTGYAPSGFPHIGTFSETVRVNMIIQAFKKLSNIPVKLICISDDLDGMRKVPDTIPNPEEYKQYIGLPLTSIPDPFGQDESYGHGMNRRMREFLDHFNCEYEFLSSTQYYKDGFFNDHLERVIEKYDEIMEVMLPTLGPERRATYSPFMPICEETGRVLQVPITSIDKENKTITYTNASGKEVCTKVTDGKCKLQWKPDFGMRWACLEVDYEFYGKDHLASGKIYSKICEILGGMPPVQNFYEMFLDKDGKKISKSSGNGVTMEEWLKYAPEESLSLFVYKSPQKAKKMYMDIIPKQVDEYITFLAKYHESTEKVEGGDEEARKENPVYHIHFASDPPPSIDISYSLILNLIEACGSDDPAVLRKYIGNMIDLNAKGSDFLDRLISCASNYYQDFVKPLKQYRVPTDLERKAMMSLAEGFLNIADEEQRRDPVLVQNIVYETAKEFEIPMKEWFQSLYQVLLGSSQGPRFGSFAVLYGLDNTVKMIREKCARTL